MAKDRLLGSQLSYAKKFMVAVTSDGETASTTVSTAVLAHQVQEALVQGQFDDAMRQLREAGIG